MDKKANMGRVTDDIVRWYFERRFALTPLVGTFGDPYRGKRPRYKNWVTRIIDDDIIYDAAAAGVNLGWVIPEGYGIFDIDPRHGGSDGFVKICADFAVDLTKEYPTVVSGSNGWHIYFKLPSGVTNKHLVSEIDQYPGIDLRTHGTQCVIPGSYHYNANRLYRWDEGSPYNDTIKEMRPDILKLWRRTINEREADDIGLGLNNDELQSILDQIPADKYNTNASWFPIMCASHHATCGAGLPAFIGWSLSDPAYTGHDEQIAARWRSLNNKAVASITYKTLFATLFEHNGKLPQAIRAKIDFANAFDIVDPSDLNVDTAERAAKTLRDDNAWATIKNEIEQLTPDSGQVSIDSMLERVSGLKPIDRDAAVQLIKKLTGRSLPMLRKLVERKAVANQTQELLAKEAARYEVSVSDALSGDLATHIAVSVIDHDYDRGRNICLAPDGCVWVYNGKHWIAASSYQLDKQAVMSIDRYVQNNPGTTVSTDTISRLAVSLIHKVVQYKQDLFDGHARKNKTVINTQTHEVWIDDLTGAIEVRDHSPDSNQLGVTSFDYDPDADCPLFDETLMSIFKHDQHREDTIRHLIELIGYSIQDNKNLATWVMLQGGGSNGKTVILELLSKLAGGRTLAIDIQDIDTARSAHVGASLVGKLVVIDDDVASNEKLPDGALKKLSENKSMTANPKFKESFEFRNTAIPWLAANEWPYAKDGSYGMQRRANVFQLATRFNPGDSDYDPHRSDRLVSELSGIFNKALIGLSRLRQRGVLKPPKSCIDALGDWQMSSNPTYRFLTCHVDAYKPHSHVIKFVDIWEHYALWCTEEGIRYRLAKQRFKESLQVAGCHANTRGEILLPAKWLSADRLDDALSSGGVLYFDALNDLCRKKGEDAYSQKAIRMILKERDGVEVESDKSKIVCIKTKGQKNDS